MYEDTVNHSGRPVLMEKTNARLLASVSGADVRDVPLPSPVKVVQYFGGKRGVNFGLVEVESPQDDQALELLARDDQSTESVRPVFKTSNGHLCAETDQVFLGFHLPADITRLQGIDGVRQVSRITDREFLVRFDSPMASNWLSRLEEHVSPDELEFVERDLLMLSTAPPPLFSDASILSDPLFSEQWSLAKIHAPEAWALAAPSSKISIAIVDVGVDADHPDLDIADGINTSSEGGSFTPAAWEFHGTLCAGIIGATPNNERGMRGVAGGCRLVAIKVADQAEDSPQWLWSFESARKAFEWAWKSGVDVISCSWEASWDGDLPSNAVNREIERARAEGRGGKGCVVVFSAGNYSGGATESDVTYPANLAGILTVSAVNRDDQFTTHTTSTGTQWGSSSGPEVDITAPGVEIYTTDIHGDGGVVPNLVPGDSDYFRFNGTSAAAPIVAGVAALVLSANPELSEAEVREVLCHTADKVDTGNPYQDGRNNQVGFGRVNARAAVQEAIDRKKTH